MRQSFSQFNRFRARPKNHERKLIGVKLENFTNPLSASASRLHSLIKTPASHLEAQSEENILNPLSL